MVLHGPGMIVRYQYINGEVYELRSYSEKDFNRITTHKIFYYCKKPFLAVTGYPMNPLIQNIRLRLINPIGSLSEIRMKRL